VIKTVALDEEQAMNAGAEDRSAELRAESDRLARTRLSSTLRLAPVGNVLGDVAGVLGEHVLTLMGMFYPRPLCKRANVVVTELVTNVLENIVDPESEMRFLIEVDAEKLVIEVQNRVSDEQFENVRARIDRINSSSDVRALLKQTIRERRPQRLKGGLGFMRLATENKFELSAERQDGYMTIRAVHRVVEAR
jgi:hypothetical protein